MMEGEIRLLVLALVLSACTVANARDICNFFLEIPKVPWPEDFPEQNFEGVPWAQRPLLPVLRDEKDMCMPNMEDGTQFIYIEEEIHFPFIIAKLNIPNEDIDCAPTQSCLPFINVVFGVPALLSATIEQRPDIDNGWYLIINERQDYENINNRVYVLSVNVPGQTPSFQFVTIELVNIDDNEPILHILDNCEIEELNVLGLTDCKYEVMDPDGRISTQDMTFEIKSDRGDYDIFGIYVEHDPNDEYRLDITIETKETLNFQMSPLHIFSISAFDSLSNEGNAPIMVQVVNVESREPHWLQIWAMQQFDEKTEQNFTFQAIDGDTGINGPIFYRLNNPENFPHFKVETLNEGRGGGILYVESIDRDELRREVFDFGIVAYKRSQISDIVFETEQSVVIIVNDVNDNEPEPDQDYYEISIDEETPFTFNFEDFAFEDIDLGEHAQYMITVESINPTGFEAAFYVAPTQGYQYQELFMGTLRHEMLDFDDEKNQVIDLKLTAQEVSEPSHYGEIMIRVNLINWNDELPIFETQNIEVSLDETVEKGHNVTTVKANDRDIDDIIYYSLMGNANDFLTIDEKSGDIWVGIDDAFDYHRLNEIYVQVRATDSLGPPPHHVDTTQIVIRLNDINNTPPSLRLPRGSPQIQENVPAGTLITDQITATDPDTTAKLVFRINWDESYATKQGRETPTSEFHNCVEIITVYRNEGSYGDAIGVVKVQNVRPGVTLDFEEFEVLYLAVEVTDLNTILGTPYDELTFTIIIVDMNDNEPVWAPAELSFSVRENADADVVIGSVLATDIDGPLYNQVRYTISPREDTPDGLVKVNFYTGELTVGDDQAIDADTPPRYHLFYTITASDRCYAEDRDDCPPDDTEFNIPIEIEIRIIDVNNKIPYMDNHWEYREVEIYENAVDNDPVYHLLAFDDDRDELYHTVNYTINYQVNLGIRDFFAVDAATGLIYVEYGGSNVLDRDRGDATHRIFITVFDNFLREGGGVSNPVTAELLVILKDVNDNPPVLPQGLSWSVLENLSEGHLLEEIFAEDIDEPGTPNSQVAYKILSQTVTDRDIETPDLFDIITVDYRTGDLVTAMDLRGYWGSYELVVTAFDHGVPVLNTTETYTVVIRPYNFNAPTFVFPQENTIVRIARERALVNQPLYTVDDELLELISATDEDGLHAGDVTFQVVGDAASFFTISNEGDGSNVGTLVITQLILDDIRTFQVTIRATDGGTEPGPLFTDRTLSVAFVPIQSEPHFETNTAEVDIVEFEEALEQSFQLPEAVDNKNYHCLQNCHVIYYHIVGGNEEGHFALNSRTNELLVVIELNREESLTHTLLVAASNSETPPSNTNSALTVNVHVLEANPRPRFVSGLYTAGISVGDPINREIITVQATHSLATQTIRYSIDLESMQIDSSLEAVREHAFLIGASTGILTLNIQPTLTMHGAFEFDVVATDDDEQTDRTEVKIYLISSRNRVVFLFINTLEQIQTNRDFIAQTFSVGFGMTCNIDSILPSTDENGVAQIDETDVEAHFIEDGMPVPTEVIDELQTDTELLRAIQQTLAMELLNFDGFLIGRPSAQSGTQILAYVFMALTGVMTLACGILLVVYCTRTRTLHHRLEALTTTRFGSVDSGLNRAGAIVPGTNKHAVTTNPVWNEELRSPDFDALSDASNDSDLIGIEDMPQFSSGDNFRPQQEIPTHSNNFGFASPTALGSRSRGSDSFL